MKFIYSYIYIYIYIEIEEAILINLIFINTTVHRQLFYFYSLRRTRFQDFYYLYHFELQNIKKDK